MRCFKIIRIICVFLTDYKYLCCIRATANGTKKKRGTR